ncbi:GntR family transcriptional regulator, transcriptional repressor for pyruvate dehydrogenase complex [Halopseudomonas sabulinigri]|uniref:Pyruvate dehydrogenase complex repressor n=1 Tax=Halopseudomonas sabulinigri TaxID=472181 RepID=A0A1H1S7L3_9GAMM|nr:GntR family transcriptional regulator [Halopseudomonas sabulinigri]SDS43911.1 GntR family transcriptional regulator, transcriptional repressor for pyruvate dehydrogenase complex [Halopseudomonas sabulinigri]
MEVGQVRQRRLADNIVEQLETMILEGTLQPGQRLPAERALAEQFGVSRPSLREAVQKLAAKGLLTSRQGGGNYVSENLGSSFSDPLLGLLEGRPEAQRDLLEFRHTLEADCAYYAAKRATELDRQNLQAAYDSLQACYASGSKASRAEEGAADARFHLAIAEASHNMVLLHTIRGLFDLLKRNVVTNIGGMYALREESRRMLVAQHGALFEAIMQGQADEARRQASEHISYVQEVLDQSQQESLRLARAQRRDGTPKR